MARIVIGVLISALCLWLALKDVPLDSVGAAIAGADPFWLGIAALGQVAALLARAARWRVLLAGGASIGDSFWAQAVGYLFTNVFPLRLGEAARVVALALRARLPVTQVAATALLDRVLDVASVVVMLVVVLPLVAVPPEVQRAGLIFGIAVIGVLAVLLVMARLGSTGERLIEAVARRVLPQRAHLVTDRWRELLVGLHAVSSGRAALLAVCWSAVTWLISIVSTWCVLRAFQPAATPVEATFMLSALAFAVSVPSTPGFIGVYQWVGQQVLAIPFSGSYSASMALGVAILVHLIYYVTTTLLGGVGLLRLGYSVGTLRQLVAGKSDRAVVSPAAPQEANA